MVNILGLLFSLVAGGLAGCVFFGGLWWTVRVLPALSEMNAAMLFLASFLLRMGVVLLVLFVVGQGRWERMLACGAGMLLVRLIWVRVVQRKGEPA